MSRGPTLRPVSSGCGIGRTCRMRGPCEFAAVEGSVLTPFFFDSWVFACLHTLQTGAETVEHVVISSVLDSGANCPIGGYRLATLLVDTGAAARSLDQRKSVYLVPVVYVQCVVVGVFWYILFVLLCTVASKNRRDIFFLLSASCWLRPGQGKSTQTKKRSITAHVRRK